MYRNPTKNLCSFTTLALFVSTLFHHFQVHPSTSHIPPLRKQSSLCLASVSIPLLYFCTLANLALHELLDWFISVLPISCTPASTMYLVGHKATKFWRLGELSWWYHCKSLGELPSFNHKGHVALWPRYAGRDVSDVNWLSWVEPSLDWSKMTPVQSRPK